MNLTLKFNAEVLQARLNGLVPAEGSDPSAPLGDHVLHLSAAVDSLTATVNALITAYNALAAELDVDTGVANADYGTGPTQAPAPVPSSNLT